MVLVSIIVPAYNVEKYIQKSIRSILNQSFHNFELLIVDDGSTDNTGKLCDCFETKDNRVKVFHKRNGGLSDARNFALDRMSGKYVTFIDGDDYVSEDYLEKLYTLITIENDIQIAMTSIQRVIENTDLISISDTEIEILSGEQAVKKILLQQNVSHTAPGKLYNAELWSDLRFPIGQNYEDYALIYKVFGKTDKVSYANYRNYFYVMRNNSIMHQTCSERTLSVLDVSDQTTAYIIERWNNCKIEALRLQTVTYMKNLQAILNTGWKAFPTYQERILKVVKNNAKDLLGAHQVGLKDKVKIISLLIGKPFFLFLYNRFDGSKNGLSD